MKKNMNKYVALLRGINVGGNNKIAMHDLKISCKSIGLENVKTYINSGNVIFQSIERDADHLAQKIEEVILKDFNVEIPVVIRNARNIRKLSKEIPSEWTNDTEQKTDILFLYKKYKDKKSIKLLDIKPEVDHVRYIDKAIVWNLKKSEYTKSGINNLIGTEIYKNMTARNINTVRKLASMLDEE